MKSIYQMKIESFVECVREWMRNGWTMEEAIDHARHMADGYFDTSTLEAAEKEARKEINKC